ncbi:MAG: hypothetical protein LBF26_03265 [Puniceicoccales bacterium]|nr:hypothetical protein [Puniceicoccales bacterium]
MSSGSEEFEFAVQSRNGGHLNGSGKLNAGDKGLAELVSTSTNAGVACEGARILCANLGVYVSLATAAVGAYCGLHSGQALGVIMYTYFVAVLAGADEVGTLADQVNDAIDRAVDEIHQLGLENLRCIL